MAKISIIIPVYNVEQYLERCLESVINQTLSDIEIICVNDGSEDNSKEILKKYAKKDSRIVVINKDNGGVSDARNKGMELVTSPYIAFVDSDDWIEKRTLEESYQAIKKYNVDFVCYGFRKIYENGTSEVEKLPYKGFKKIGYREARKTSVTVTSKIFRTSIIKEKQCLFPIGYHFEDNVFWMMYSAWIKTGYYINKPLYNYFQRENSIIHTDKKQFKCIELIPIIFDYYKKLGLLKTHEKNLYERFKDYLKMDFYSNFEITNNIE